MIHSNLKVKNGRLYMADTDVSALAREHGTPLMVMDENRIRNNMRTYADAMKKHFGNGSHPHFASKAFSCKYIYRLAKEEKIGIDVVSSGEMYTAASAGFDLSNAFFHGNNKTDFDIEYGIENGIGYFVVDNMTELDSIDRIAGEKGIVQPVLLRVSPGIDPHTFAAVATGKVDSKFGVAIETGQASEAAEYALSKKNIHLSGFHCHIGSQIFEIGPFTDAASIMVSYMASLKKKLGYNTEILNLGGGFGVRYTEEQPIIDIEEFISKIAQHVNREIMEYGLVKPTVIMEPGRSIVADTSLTLYTVGGTKEIPGFKNYVSVDGGMSDNPRYALYGAEYTVCLPEKMDNRADFVCTVAGRCCESGDVLQENVKLPKPVRGDILAVLVTGAYNYSMASNYNRIPRPEVVAITNDGVKTVIKAETFEDLIKNDI